NRNGVGVILKEEFVRNVLEVKRVSDRVISLKLEIEGVVLNVASCYAPQVGCKLEEMVVGADFNGHVGEGNRGDEEVMGRFGVKEGNLVGQSVVERMEMAIANTYREDIELPTIEQVEEHLEIQCKVESGRGEEANANRRMLEMEMPGKMDVLKEDMKVVGARVEDTEDRVRSKRIQKQEAEQGRQGKCHREPLRAGTEPDTLHKGNIFTALKLQDY
ncbi:hypothetical protein DNTS_028165, partial [Danionella cerebrum]